MGWSVPATLGYELGCGTPTRVIAMIGDGSFQLTAQEISTMIRYNVKPIIVLINNRGYTIEAEIKRDHVRGTVATARLGDQVNPEKRSSGSQFFINVKDNGFLNGGYTVFGNVIAGMDVADKIANVPRDERDNPNDRVEMKVSITTRAEALKK